MRTTLTKESLEPTLVITLVDYQPSARYDELAWTGAQFESSVDGVSWTTVDTVTFADPDLDPTQPKSRTFTVETIPVTAVYVRIVFTDANDGIEHSDPVTITPASTFSTVRDVRLRLGRDLSNDEIAQAQALLMSATFSIYGTLGMPPAWIVPTDARGFLNMMSTEMVVRSMNNPYGVAQRSETIGAYSHSESYGSATSGLALSKAEQQSVRSVVFGSTTTSVKVRSQADEYAEVVYPLEEVDYAFHHGEWSELGSDDE